MSTQAAAERVDGSDDVPDARPGRWARYEVVYLAIQQAENHLLVPQIMQRAVNLHPVAVVLSILVGASLLGIAGALVAVPVAAALAVALDELRAARASAAHDDRSGQTTL